MKNDQRDEILQKFDRINVWTRGDERAPTSRCSSCTPWAAGSVANEMTCHLPTSPRMWVTYSGSLGRHANRTTQNTRSVGFRLMVFGPSSPTVRSNRERVRPTRRRASCSSTTPAEPLSALCGQPSTLTRLSPATSPSGCWMPIFPIPSMGIFWMPWGCP